MVIAVPLVLACGLSGLAALPGRGSISGDVAESSDEVVQDDGYFYGDSPPVYPSRKSKFLTQSSWGFNHTPGNELTQS